MKAWKLLLVMMLAMGLVLMIAACGDDDDDNGVTPTETIEDELVGVWLSAGENVAPLLVMLFTYDSVRVTFNEDQTVVLEAHVADGAWTTQNGLMSATESDTGDVHAIEISYTAPNAFTQNGILQITEGTPDVLKLEVVQTEPDIGATVPTVEAGFGADAALGEINIQFYERVE